MMTVDEIYEFDLNGYIVYRNFLSPEDVTQINGIIESAKGARGSGKFSFFDLDSCFIELMAHPLALGILKGMLGDWLRFDHAFGIEMTKTSSVTENLHAGPLENQGAFWYQWVHGRMHNGMIKVMYALTDVNPGDGGFICVPGSHKANMHHRPKHDSHLVINPTLKAGDMLIFTEALVHGSCQWVGEQTRRVIFYSYAPGCLIWKNYDWVKPYLALATNDLQKELLRPPNVGSYDEQLAALTGVWPNDWRQPIKLPRLEDPLITQTRENFTQLGKSFKKAVTLGKHYLKTPKR